MIKPDIFYKRNNDSMEEKCIENLSLKELLDYKRAVDVLFDFYDNEMKANTGEYEEKNAEIFKNASKETSKYLALKEKIFFEIKKRVDSII